MSSLSSFVNDNRSDSSEMDEEVPIARHVHELFTSLVSVDTPLDDKLQQAQLLQSFLSRPDGYIEFHSFPCEAQLPPLEWNRHFKKSYSILCWIRPQLSTTTTEQPISTHNNYKQVLYRFSTSEKDSKGAGLCVQMGEWHCEEHGDTLSTTLTAFLLPTQSQQTAMTHASLLQIPLTLRKNQWQLLGISHVYPYLKPSKLTISVNGTVLSSGELAYPVVDNYTIMEFASLFSNIGSGGASVTRKSASNTTANATSDDDKTPASLLQHTSTAARNQANTTRYPLKWQVATVALYPDYISPDLLAICADAGVALSLQHDGRILTPLPPVPNSTKGTCLDPTGGPSVGIPLSKALAVQHLISRVVIYVSATNAQVLKTRIVCPFLLGGGHFESTPKVGLMQPSIPLRVEAAIHFLGARVLHALSNYLLTTTCLQHLNVAEASHCWSVVVQEQALISTVAVLPFFLALPPSIAELQPGLYEASLQQLYTLYRNQGQWAAMLVKLLVTALEHHGGRCQEEVLQNGILHTLSSTLRRSLVRAQQLKVWDYECYEAFRASISFPEPPIRSATSPKRIPFPIAQACAELVAVCCGPAPPPTTTTAMENNTPTVRLDSDLAMTAVFGFALDLDLWGVSVSSATLVMGAVAERYGGTFVQRGTILRNQIPVQSLLDQIRIRYEGLTPELEPVAQSLASILVSMLLSSLFNKRNVTQSEHDVSACIGALSDCPLGTVGAHVILTALEQLLEWCDIIPTQHGSDVSDDDKLQVATRLGRNLLMGQYHDVVAPMLLSRTVFCGERVLAQSDAPHLWQYHWRLSLLLFVVSTKCMAWHDV